MVKITYGIIGILSLLVVTGGTLYLTSEQLENAYICSINQNIVVADHLSSTSKTAYWIDEDGNTKSKVCRNGFWLDLKQYSIDNNIEINILINNEYNNSINLPLTQHKKIQYRCDSTKCRKIQ